MAKHRGTVLIDNNAIGEAVDIGVWKGILGSYAGQLATVTEIAGEAGSYFRQLPDGAELLTGFTTVQVHDVLDPERRRLRLRVEGIALDPGEFDLWAHAFERLDNWILCGPDRATLRTAVRLGLEERLISLEALLAGAGLSTRNLHDHHRSNWLRRVVGELVVRERKI